MLITFLSLFNCHQIFLVIYWFFLTFYLDRGKKTLTPTIFFLIIFQPNTSLFLHLLPLNAQSFLPRLFPFRVTILWSYLADAPEFIQTAWKPLLSSNDHIVQTYYGYLMQINLIFLLFKRGKKTSSLKVIQSGDLKDERCSSGKNWNLCGLNTVAMDNSSSKLQNYASRKVLLLIAHKF